MFIPTEKCYQLSLIQSLHHLLGLLVTMVLPGHHNKKSSLISLVQF